MTEGFMVLDTENNVAIGDKLNIQKATKSSFGNAARKKLADISNVPQQSKGLTRDEKSLLLPIPTNDYIDQLQKENKALLKIIAERKKLIEVTGIELKKLRIHLQKMQQQNQQLAQSNSQMLAGLNSSKDRLKALQHVLGCKNGLLKAQNMEVQEKLKAKNCKILVEEVRQTNYSTVKESKVGMEDDILENAKRMPESKSLGSSRQVGSKDRNASNDHKRACTRRQSARFQHEELKPADSLFPNEDVRTSVCLPSDDSLQPNGSTSMGIPFKDEERECNDGLGLEAKNRRPCARRRSSRFKPEEPKPCEDLFQIPESKVSVCLVRDDAAKESGFSSTCSEGRGFIRSSLSRPSREAAKKIQTYKEVPLNKKMRRTD